MLTWQCLIYIQCNVYIEIIVQSYSAIFTLTKQCHSFSHWAELCFNYSESAMFSLVWLCLVYTHLAVLYVY